MFKVYLAARFSRKDEMKQKAAQLETYGIKVTSRWPHETAAPDSTLDQFSADSHRKTAEDDIEDIVNADAIVFFSEDPLVGTPRGGRHFESGFAFGLGIPMLIVGPRENIFHYLHQHTQVDTWDKAVEVLYRWRDNGGPWDNQADGFKEE